MMWPDFGVAIGLVLVIEGLLWAAAPSAMRRALTVLMAQSEDSVRLSGVVAAGLGVVVVYLIRA